MAVQSLPTYIDTVPHAGSSDLMYNAMFDEPTGTVARTMPRGTISSAALASFTTGGQVAVRSIPLPAGLIVSNISILTGSTAATGPTHFWLALLDSGLNVQAVSADQGAAAIAASTMFKLAMTVSYQIPLSGLYYIAASVSASTTAPTAAGGTLAAGTATTAPILCGSAGTQAAPPAVGAQLASGVVTQNINMNFAAWIS